MSVAEKRIPSTPCVGAKRLISYLIAAQLQMKDLYDYRLVCPN